MERTLLTTDFVCLATAGATIDGREITASQLKEMAESYDPKIYTANIWREHYRTWNFGQVVSLEYREENGSAKLYGKLSPNQAMIEYNKLGQGLFLSIEITPNFANSGKCYLSGLAVTDSPASLGTTQLMFNILGETTQMNTVENDTSKQHFFKGFLDWLFNQETDKAQTNKAQTDKAQEQQIEKTNFSEGDQPLTKEELKAVIESCLARFSQDQAKPADNPVDNPEKNNAETETVSKVEFNDLQSKFEELEQKFNAATQGVATQIPNGAGGVKENENQHFNVDFAI